MLDVKHVLSRFPCFAHLAHRPSSTGLHLPPLDGWRGLAALMVLYFHFYEREKTWLPHMYGSYGVFLFFVLSGFLLVQRYTHMHAREFIPQTLFYLCRRLLRILPLYCAGVLFFAWQGHRGETWIWDHLLFRRSDGILWTVKQEMAFYCLLPVIMAALLCLRRLEWRAAALLALAVLANRYLTADILPMTYWQGPDQHVRLYLSVFLIGMAAGCLVHNPALQRLRFSPQARLYGIALFLIAMIAWWLVDRHVLNLAGAWDVPLASVFALMLMLACLLPASPPARIGMFLPLRAIGIVGYSFYIWHAVVLDALWSAGFSGLGVFFGAIALNYLLSCVTYCLVEVPFIRLGYRLP